MFDLYTPCPSDRTNGGIRSTIRLNHPPVRRTGGCRTTRLRHRVDPMRPHTRLRDTFMTRRKR
eukprot:2941922-Prymnesium_polylepis.2